MKVLVCQKVSSSFSLGTSANSIDNCTRDGSSSNGLMFCLLSLKKVTWSVQCAHSTKALSGCRSVLENTYRFNVDV